AGWAWSSRRGRCGTGHHEVSSPPTHEGHQLSKREVLELVPLFAGFSNHLLTVMVRRCDAVHAAAGSTLMHEGQAVDQFYVLVRGAVTLTGMGDPVTTLMAPADTVGLGSVLRRQPAPTTARVAADAAVLRFAANEFWQLAGTSSELLPALTAGLVKILGEC